MEGCTLRKKKLFVKSNCARVGFAVFHLYTLASGKVGEVTITFFQGGQAP